MEASGQLHTPIILPKEPLFFYEQEAGCAPEPL